MNHIMTNNVDRNPNDVHDRKSSPTRLLSANTCPKEKYDLSSLSEKALSRTFCGSYLYAAPELLRAQPYVPVKAHMWYLMCRVVRCFSEKGKFCALHGSKKLVTIFKILQPLEKEYTFCSQTIMEKKIENLFGSSFLPVG